MIVDVMESDGFDFSVKVHVKVEFIAYHKILSKLRIIDLTSHSTLVKGLTVKKL